ncbi:hypothetical protein JCM3774_001449 [Rhodotorula dairenensis]
MQSPLAAAFDYPVRLDSLARGKSNQQHAPQSSTSSTASTSSSSAGLGLGRGRGRGHAQTHAYGYSSSSAHTRSSSIATDLTTASSSYGDASPSGSKHDPFAFQEDNQYSAREQSQLEDGWEQGGLDEHLPRTDSTLAIRERTRYRSSASYAPPIPTTYPLQGAFGSLSISSAGSPFDQDDDARLGSSENAHLELLAALAATSTTLDTCFCGSAPEEGSIYCSRACAQADALNALCGGGSGSGSGGSSGAEDGAASSDAASLRSYHSGGMSSGAESSHYRRVEKEETRRATEKERALRRLKSHRKPVPKQDGFERTSSSTGSEPGAKAPSPASSRATSSLSRRLPPLSSATASSRRSSSSCLPPSPLRGSVSSPYIIEPSSASEEEDADNVSRRGLGFDHAIRPCTPSPRIGTSTENADGSMLVSDIYASYLTATPRDGQHHLQTPTSHLVGGSGAPSGNDGLASTPRAVYLAQSGHLARAEEEEDEESPTQHCGTSGVGLRMLELCDSDDEDGAEAPAVRNDRGRSQRGHAENAPHARCEEDHPESRDSLREGGWAGGHRMQQRMASMTGGASSPSRASSSSSSSAVADRLYGHMRGKLSFDDVVGILGA